MPAARRRLRLKGPLRRRLASHSPAAFVDPVLHHLPQRAREDRRPGARNARLRPRGADAETWEKVVRKIRTGMMPPSGAPRPERAVLDAFASDLETRLDKAAPPACRSRGARAASPQSHRVRQRDPRSARAGRRRRGAAAVGRLERGIRQHRRSAGRVAITHPGVCVGGDEDQPPGRRRSDADADPGHLSGARRAGAGPPHRGSAARHARRHARPPHVSARCGIRAQRHRRRRRRRRGRRRRHRHHARWRQAHGDQRRAASESRSPPDRTSSAPR